jgi:hypothetical protein
VLVTTPDQAMADVGGSALKLEAVQVLVVVDLSDQLMLQHGEALNTIASLVPREAQRIIASASLDGEVERFVETHVRRALTIPARAADPGVGAAARSHRAARLPGTRRSRQGGPAGAPAGRRRGRCARARAYR